MENKYHLTNKNYSYREFKPLFKGPIFVSLHSDCKKNIKKSNDRLKIAMAKDKSLYGINTGFGELCNVKIKYKDLNQLQINLVRSHASGIGDPMSAGLVRTILFLKILTYIKGFSGIRYEVVDILIKFLNNDIIPFVPKKGSVGASGDLAPLAHIALTLIGEGYVFIEGKKIKTSVALKKLNIIPLVLKPKEGLSLINGTQVSTALAIKSLINAELILNMADISAALSIENSFSSKEVFESAIHQLKKHPGQRIVAKNICKLLEGSEIVASHKDCDRVQDPYSFRCVPHVHGASRDCFNNVSKVIDNEINSVSDNPLVFENGYIANSGHFHAEHVAQNLDFLSISVSEIGSISERRVHCMMKGINDDIQDFITKQPGLESGYMIAHVTAAALASENRTLAHPASVDNITTSGGQEDFVSMAPWAAEKLLKIQDNVFNILSIELLVSGAANNLVLSKYKSSNALDPLKKHLKKVCNYNSGDRSLNNEIRSIYNDLKSGTIYNYISKIVNLELT